MNTYDIRQIKSLIKDEGYNYVCLQNSNGDKILNFNKDVKVLPARIAEIERKLKSKVLPDGIYYVCCSTRVGKGQSIDRLPIVKGTVIEEIKPNSVTMAEPARVVSHDVLSWDQALKYQQEIADLKSENAILKRENQLQADKIKELETSLSEMQEEEEEEEGLAESILKPGRFDFLKEIVPNIMPIFDRHYDIEEKKIALEEKKLMAAKGQLPNGNAANKVKVGSPEHLRYIDKLEKEGRDKEFNEQLDLLEQHTPEIYAKVCEFYQIEFENEDKEREEEEEEKEN